MRNINTDPSQCRVGAVSDSYKISDFDKTTFAGGLESLFYNATVLSGGARVGYIMTYKPYGGWISAENMPKAEEYIAAAKEICEKWGVSVISLWDDPAYAPETLNEKGCLTDGLHLSPAGYDYTQTDIFEWINSLEETRYAGYGYVNDDSAIDIKDLIAAKKLAAGNGYSLAADINGDFTVSADDLAILRQYLLGVIEKF